MNNFRDRYLPVFQAPDAPSGAPSGAGSPDPGVSGATPSAPSSTPAVSSEPAPPTPGSPDGLPTPDSGSDAGVDFAFLFGNAVSAEPGSPEATPGTTLPPAAPQPVKPAQQPAPAQAATPAAPQAPQTAVPQAAAPAPTDATSPAASPSLDPFDPGHLASYLQQNEAVVVQTVADSMFKLSDEDVTGLESDLPGTVSKLLAKVFVANQRNYLAQMGRLFPAMLDRHSKVTKVQSEAEAEFFKAWPDLKADNPQHKNFVDKYGAVYRTMHPAATRQEMIQALGPMVMLAAKVVPGQAQPSAPGMPGHQASPMVPTNGRPPQPSPFVPAGPASGGAAPGTQIQPNEYEQNFMYQGE